MLHGWGAKGQEVELVPAETRTCPRRNSGRQPDPSQPCGYGGGPKERLLIHPTLTLPEGRPIECPSCGWLGIIAHPESAQVAARAAIRDHRVIRLDASRGVYTLGDLMEFLVKLFPAMGLPIVHVELVGPAAATVPYEEPAEAAPPKSEVEELRERLAKLETRLAEQPRPEPGKPKPVGRDRTEPA